MPKRLLCDPTPVELPISEAERQLTYSLALWVGTAIQDQIDAGKTTAKAIAGALGISVAEWLYLQENWSLSNLMAVSEKLDLGVVADGITRYSSGYRPAKPDPTPALVEELPAGGYVGKVLSYGTPFEIEGLVQLVDPLEGCRSVLRFSSLDFYARSTKRAPSEGDLCNVHVAESGRVKALFLRED